MMLCGVAFQLQLPCLDVGAALGYHVECRPRPSIDSIRCLARPSCKYSATEGAVFNLWLLAMAFEVSLAP